MHVAIYITEERRVYSSRRGSLSTANLFSSSPPIKSFVCLRLTGFPVPPSSLKVPPVVEVGLSLPDVEVPVSVSLLAVPGVSEVWVSWSVGGSFSGFSIG